MTHTCHWPTCKMAVPPKMWGCRHHWYTLPKWIRDQIWREYRPGQEVDKRPSEAYLAIADIAQTWAACYERLLLIYEPHEAREFMREDQKLFNGASAEKLIRIGLTDQVVGVISQVVDGTHI